MTREWIDEDIPEWVMRCDEIGCPTTSEAFPKEPPLDWFMDRGWFIAEKFGDECPMCLAKGIQPKVEPYRRVSDR
ncbi:hypothetical protein [Nocardia sp. NPDC004860]|uniref:hypothetical protein n=1 Tax=Nocardia sp. NPDC004860 TaxID=3154557 RepID=UPI0033AF6F99